MKTIFLGMGKGGQEASQNIFLKNTTDAGDFQ